MFFELIGVFFGGFVDGRDDKAPRRVDWTFD